MTDTAFIDACFFKHFAAGNGLDIFDRLFPGGAMTGSSVYFELSVKHADALPGRLTVKVVESTVLLNAIADIQLHHRALSTADAELLVLAKTEGGTIYTDELPIYQACQMSGIICRRFLGCLREAVASRHIPPDDAIAFLHRELVIDPPRRLPHELVAQLLTEWEAMVSLCQFSADYSCSCLQPWLDR